MFDSTLKWREVRVQIPPRPQKPNFEISFNPNTTDDPQGDADGGPETALVVFEQPCAKDGHIWIGKKFYILKGDFRAEYEKIISGGGDESDCKRFYDDRKNEYGSRWSSDFHEWGTDGRVRKQMNPQNKPEERQSKMDNDWRDSGQNAEQELFEDAIIDKVTAILGFTELLLTRKQQDPHSEELATKAWDTARDLADLIYRTRMLRQESGK